MTGKVENLKFTDTSPTFKPKFNPIYWAFVVRWWGKVHNKIISSKYTVEKWSKEILIELKLFTHRNFWIFSRVTLEDFPSYDQRPLCSFCVISPEVHLRYFPLEGKFFNLAVGRWSDEAQLPNEFQIIILRLQLFVTTNPWKL